eukprot:GILK01003482.1.p1 GENE.GILK01003482.1~~GILK01003482.1.p1  ORF type:complete len:429 (+),score=37.65 GILK01003482.1:67-1353(+)
MANHQRDEDDDEMQNTYQVRFVTDLPEQYKIAEVPISVPGKLGRYGLSEIVNHLLALDPPKPFDFVVDDEFVRSSVEQFISSHGLSGESILVLRYVIAMPKPDLKETKDMTDWISSVDASHTECVFSASYDGSIKALDRHGDLIASQSVHKMPIKAMAVSQDPVTDLLSLVSVSKDMTVRMSVFNSAERSITTTRVGKGHTGSVDTVAIAPTAALVCTGSWDRSVKIWTSLSEDRKDSDTTARKKRKKEVKDMPCVAELLGHTQQVSAVCWPYTATLYTGSWDHTIRVWDVDSKTTVNTLTGNKIVTALSYNHVAGLLASGHEDRAVRIWDPRGKDTQVVKLALVSHSSWVSAVKWAPTSPYMLASASYDGTVKLWDIRSKIPLHTLESHEDKVLCLDWQGTSRLWSGGSDSKLVLHELDASSLALQV